MLCNVRLIFAAIESASDWLGGRCEPRRFNNEEFERGLTGIAVPIRDKQKRAIAALAINAPMARMSRERALSYLPSMRSKAEQIAAIWGLTDHSSDGDVEGD